MDTKDWQTVNDIVSDVLELDAPHRRSFIEERCGDSTEILREVESLLAGEADADSFLDSPAIANYATFFEKDDEAEALIGQKIGNYRIIRELGFGGMGAVFLARRSDGKFEQLVALKLLKREMNTAALRKHFEQERSILASLQHPNIARLLDAGTTRERIPFLVMEYVEGCPIDEYCSINDLNLEKRLDLFRQVCSVVDYAHRNLIIHRDLKPSNILVTSDGCPKLLDFGISKILSENLNEADSKTITRMGVMTPSYASPEQLKNESVTTATDVYSLGVILFELLSGRRPFEKEEAEMSAIFRAVIEREPPLPSSVVNEISPLPAPVIEPARSGPTGFSRTRQTVPQIRGVKAHQLRGDLDNIVLKALKKEPERRYLSAASFSDDIRRFHEGLPVTARPDTFAYRARKFVKRNRTSVVAVSLVILTLLAGVATTLWQARQARTESDRARAAQAKAEKTNSYLQNVLNFSNPHWLSSNPQRNREATVAQAMEEALKNIEVDLAGEPEIQGEILFTLCQSYTSQGEYPKSEALARRAIQKFDEALGPENSKSKQVSIILGDTLYLTGRFDEAEKLYRAAIDHFRPRLSEGRTHVKWLAIALHDLGNIHVLHSRFREADAVYAEAVELARTLTGKDRYALAIALGSQASMLQYRNDFQGSIDASQKALDVMREMGTDQRFEAGVIYIGNGMAYSVLKQYAKAEESHQRAEEIFMNSVGEENVYTLANRYLRANAYFKAERYGESRALLENTFRLQRKLLPGDHFSINYSKRLLGMLDTRAGALLKGEKEIRESLASMLKSLSEPNHEISTIKVSLGENLIAQKRFAEAETVLNSALDGYLKTRGDNNPYTDRCRELLNSIPKT